MSCPHNYNIIFSHAKIVHNAPLFPQTKPFKNRIYYIVRHRFSNYFSKGKPCSPYIEFDEIESFFPFSHLYSELHFLKRII